MSRRVAASRECWLHNLHNLNNLNNLNNLHNLNDLNNLSDHRTIMSTYLRAATSGLSADPKIRVVAGGIIAAPIRANAPPNIIRPGLFGRRTYLRMSACETSFAPWQ